MTIEELRLRIEAAFPTAIIRSSPYELDVDFPDAAQDGVGMFNVVGFSGAIYVGGMELYTIGRDGSWHVESHERAQLKIRDRIENVTAHQMIAARRRRMERPA